MLHGDDRLLRRRAADFRLFEGWDYLDRNKDLGGQDPLEHFVRHGVWEPHRPFARRARVAAFVAGAAETAQADPPIPAAELGALLSRAGRLDVSMHVSSRGRFHTRDLARGLAADLQAVGARAAVHDETAGPDARAPLAVVVAPHEFFAHAAEGWRTTEVAAVCWMLTADQAPSRGFRADLGYLLSARAALALYAPTAALLSQAPLPAFHYEPGHDGRDTDPTAPDHPLIDVLPREAKQPAPDLWTDRPLDLCFTGTESPVREDVLSRHADGLAELRTFIHYTRSLGVPASDDYGGRRPALNAYVARRSRIVLNLHAEEIGCVHRPRMLGLAMAHGALAVSAPCLRDPMAEPGVHYLEESPRRLMKLIRWLLETPDGRDLAARVSAQGQALVRERLTRRAMGLRLARQLLEVA